MRLSLDMGLGSIATLGTGGGWSPLNLGADLYDMWDAERSGDISLSGAAVTAWRSAKNAYSAAQAVGAARPVYSATSFNGRPGVTADGSDDELTFAGVGVLPIGASPCEVWSLFAPTAQMANGVSGFVLGWGSDAGQSAQTRLGFLGQVSGTINGVDGRVSGTFITAPGAIAGPTVVRLAVGATASQASRNGNAGSSTAAVPAVVGTRIRLFAAPNASAGAFAPVIASFMAVTAPLSAGDAAMMLAYLKTRGGIA